MSEFSVIIPVYNAARYLRECLSSVVKATEQLEKIVGVGERTGKISLSNSNSKLDLISLRRSYGGRVVCHGLRRGGIGMDDGLNRRRVGETFEKFVRR